MTDRLKGVWVAFDHDIRTDDAEATIAAIRQIRHVSDVTPEVSDHTDWMARDRVKWEFNDKILAALREIRDGKKP